MKIILDLCGGTGSWSLPYKNSGYKVITITLPDYDIRKTKIKDGHIIFIGNEKSHLVVAKEVYGILAAPPCTEFSLAKSTKPRDFSKGMIVVQHCFRIIWLARKNLGLKFWAMENPRGFLRQFIGRPAFTFEQWEFGESGIKPTDLWGFFNEPKKSVKIRPGGMSKKYPNGRWNAKGWSKSAEKRAITPAGFAKAFMEVNP